MNTRQREILARAKRLLAQGARKGGNVGTTIHTANDSETGDSPFLAPDSIIGDQADDGHKRLLPAQDAEWDESKHPRDEQGRFGSGGSNLNAQSKVNFPELSASEVANLAKTPITLEEKMPMGARKKAIALFIQQHLQGKSVKASDGKSIQFNRNDSVQHLSFNGRRAHLAAQLVPHIADVFANGEYIGREDPKHGRKDDTIVAFHIYRKWIELQRGYKVHVEAHAAERSDGPFEYAAYAHKKIDTAKDKGSQNLHADDTGNSTRKLESGLTAFDDNPTPVADSAQEEYELLRILRIVDAKGQDVTGSYNEKPPAERIEVGSS